ncbi:NAD(P)/FAD-dependent oxidoreductase [Microbacterium sp. cf046]|uniref:protoporphyrinogen/coproporphyrinogen oxidase n=1 Tax=Microbacterium sp. cf046 TaxID=1761803 RepID=UPI000B807A7F|nr:FAD-dependent oxidoreductase [Microbacterium sp. cf046]
MPASQPRPSSPSAAPGRVVVVGAGAAGLVVARDLARAGVAVTLVEASDHVGGQLATIRLAGLDIDAAAESFATRGGTVAALATELGLAADLVLPRDSPAWLIAARGAAHPLPAASVLGIPGDPRAHDVAAAIGLRGAWRARLDSIVPLRRPEAYGNLGDLVRRRMGARVLDGLVAPVVRGVYSTSPDELLLELASPGLPDALRSSWSLGAAVERLRAASPAGSQVAGLRGGVHRLAGELERDARAAGAQIRLGTRVASTDRDGVLLDTGERIDGHVVLGAAEAAGAARTRDITVAIAVVDAAGLDDAPRGTGALVAEGATGITARAFTHSTAKWQWLADQLPPGRHVVRLSYDEMPDDPERTVIADLGAVTGARIDRVIDLDVRTWTRTLQAHPAAVGQDAVGEASSTTGLASIVAAARETARTIAARISTEATGAHSGDPEGSR